MLQENKAIFSRRGSSRFKIFQALRHWAPANSREVFSINGHWLMIICFRHFRFRHFRFWVLRISIFVRSVSKEKWSLKNVDWLIFIFPLISLEDEKCSHGLHTKNEWKNSTSSTMLCTSVGLVFFSFFGRIEGTKKSFRN